MVSEETDTNNTSAVEHQMVSETSAGSFC